MLAQVSRVVPFSLVFERPTQEPQKTTSNAFYKLTFASGNIAQSFYSLACIFTEYNKGLDIYPVFSLINDLTSANAFLKNTPRSREFAAITNMLQMTIASYYAPTTIAVGIQFAKGFTNIVALHFFNDVPKKTTS